MKIEISGELMELGTFQLTGPVMRVSDPCYTRDVWCCGTVDNCRTGTWEAAILKKVEGDWGERVSVLAARHESSRTPFSVLRSWIEPGKRNWSFCPFEVGVDSGQAGLFDDLHYQDSIIEEWDLDPQTLLSIHDDILRVDWYNADEGICGDYDPDNPEDMNLLRFDVYVKGPTGWEEVDDASYCSMIPASAPKDSLRRTLRRIFKKYREVIMSYPVEYSVKHLGENLSWITDTGEEVELFDQLWYDRCCQITLSRLRAGVLPNGVVSSSGFGDGGYTAFTHKDSSGRVDFIFIVFIDDRDNEEEVE